MKTRPDLVPVSVRDLIEHLPELLAGSEPVLRREAVRTYLRANPDASSAILAVAHAARAMRSASDWMRALPRHAGARLCRPLEIARKYFRKELVGLLFDVGLADFEEASERLGLALDRRATAGRAGPPPDLTRVTGQLAEALGLDALPAALPAHDPDDPLARAEQLMAACDDLIPGLFGVRFYRLFLPQLRTGKSDSRAWMRYVDEAPGASDKYAGLCRAARAHLLEGRPEVAADLSAQAGAHAPHSTFPPYSAALCRGWMNAPDRMADSLNRWLEQIGPFPVRAQLGARQVRSDRHLWRPILRRTEAALERVRDGLPEPIATAFQEIQTC